MVDALRRAIVLLRPAGCILDVHPTVTPADVKVETPAGRDVLGRVEAPGAWHRHARADAAVGAAIEQGFLTADGAVEFSFRRYGESIDELRGYLAQKTTDAHVAPETIDRARAAQAQWPRAPLWIEEYVRLTKLRPRVS
jgi:hypothetical protein